jgi:hypothetical protein
MFFVIWTAGLPADMDNSSTVSMYKVAAVTALGLAVFFIAMKFLHLVTIVELRFVNFFILLLGVRKMLLSRRKENNGRLEYLPGMLLGFMTAFLASVFFAAFVFLYLSFLDHGLMEYIRNHQPFGSYLTPGGAALIIILEGVASGAILSFAMMHLYNRDSAQG